MSRLRLNFLNWRPDANDLGHDGLTVAKNVLHDTEGYKPLSKQTTGAFSQSSFYSGVGLSSVRSIQVRPVAALSNKVAAMCVDNGTNIVNFSIGLEGEVAAFTTVSSGTLISAGAARVAALSVAEMEYGAFGVCALFNATLQAGTVSSVSLTGEVTFTVVSESSSTPGSGGTSSLEGTNAEHTQTNANGDAYAGIYLKSDGNEYAFSSSGTYQGTLLSAWLDSGTVDGMWLYAQTTAGTLEVDSGTEQWLALSTSRQYGIKRATSGTTTASVTLQVATDSAGENVIDTAVYNLKAIRDDVSLVGDASYHHLTREAATCTAGVSLNSNGTEYAYSEAGSATGYTVGNWLGGGAAGSFYVRCTVLSGTLTSGTEDTWTVMSSTQNFYIQQALLGLKQTSIKLEIADDAGGTNIIATAQYNLSAEYLSSS